MVCTRILSLSEEREGSKGGLQGSHQVSHWKQSLPRLCLRFLIHKKGIRMERDRAWHSNSEVSPPLDELQEDDHQGPVSGPQNPSGKWSETQCWGDYRIQRV